MIGNARGRGTFGNTGARLTGVGRGIAKQTEQTGVGRGIAKQQQQTGVGRDIANQAQQTGVGRGIAKPFQQQKANKVKTAKKLDV